MVAAEKNSLMLRLVEQVVCGTLIDFLVSKVLIVTIGISATAFSFLW